jgi:hypothetical protein
VRKIVLAEGLKGGVALAVVSILFAVIGLSPSLTWVPELPLLAAAVLFPVAIIGIAGFRVGAQTRLVWAGALAGTLAGAIGGLVGGFAYVFFGKAMLNVAVGLVAGALGGATVGTTGALLSRRTGRPQTGPGTGT